MNTGPAIRRGAAAGRHDVPDARTQGTDGDRRSMVAGVRLTMHPYVAGDMKKDGSDPFARPLSSPGATLPSAGVDSMCSSSRFPTRVQVDAAMKTLRSRTWRWPATKI